jgi:hypothetical protein
MSYALPGVLKFKIVQATPYSLRGNFAFHVKAKFPRKLKVRSSLYCRNYFMPLHKHNSSFFWFSHGSHVDTCYYVRAPQLDHKVCVGLPPPRHRFVILLHNTDTLHNPLTTLTRLGVGYSVVAWCFEVARYLGKP